MNKNIKEKPRELDELLEKIWTQREKGEDGRDSLLAITPIKESEKWLKVLEDEKLITINNGRVQFLPAGEKEAEQIIRRHRLTERLFADVFDISEEIWEREACELEHRAVLSDEAINAICAFLGHPPTCPHGRPIPRGECCGPFKEDLKPFVIPLSEAPLGKPCRIVFITPKTHARLERLAVLGVLPGNIIQLHQRKPSYVLKIGETDIALDPDIAENIYVKNLPLLG